MEFDSPKHIYLYTWQIMKTRSILTKWLQPSTFFVCNHKAFYSKCQSLVFTDANSFTYIYHYYMYDNWLKSFKY
jgi:hypothetical protein